MGDEMAKVEVLVAALDAENNTSLYHDMKISTDAVIANQCNESGYFEFGINGRRLKQISTTDRGVGKNRNLGIIHATGDILIFADDDVVYKEGYERIVQDAFAAIPQADAIIFNATDLNPKTKKSTVTKRVKKLNIFGGLKYPTYRIAVKKEALLRANVWFSLMFGGGARYCAGEDTLFIRQMIKNGLKVYAHPAIIADALQESSTWFTGHNEGYFHDRGALLQALFPKTSFLFSVVYAFKYMDRTDEYTPWQVWCFLRRGIKDFKRGEHRGT